MKHVLYISFALLLLTACTESFDLDPDQSIYRIGIEATLTNQDTLQYVTIMESKRVTDNAKPYLSGAEVYLIENGTDTVFYVETEAQPGIYATPGNFAGKPGASYELVITQIDYNLDGVMDTSRATETMPDELIIDSITATYAEIEKFEMSGWYLNCYAVEPSVDNWYLFRAWRNNILQTDTLYEYYTADDALLVDYINGIQCHYLDDYKAGEKVESGDTVSLEICNITKGFMYYILDAQAESPSNSGIVNMFTGPPANVESNFSGDIAGYFEVYASTKKSLVLTFDRDTL